MSEQAIRAYCLYRTTATLFLPFMPMLHGLMYLAATVVMLLVDTYKIHQFSCGVTLQIQVYD